MGSVGATVVSGVVVSGTVATVLVGSVLSSVLVAFALLIGFVINNIAVTTQTVIETVIT